jgi:hypothetical protein
MANQNGAGERLAQVEGLLTSNKTATTIPWDPDCTQFPTRNELPKIPGAPKDAAWVWGKDDYVCSVSSMVVDRRLMLARLVV